MNRYDPLKASDPQEWLELDEAERIELVLDYHRKARIKVPNVDAHATMHTIVENQIAEGDKYPVRRTLKRLQAEGLDRHDALHAIASVLIAHFHDLLKEGLPESGDPNDAYWAGLEKLTAKSWLESG